MNVLLRLSIAIFFPLICFSQFKPIPISNADRYLLNEISRDTQSVFIKYFGNDFSFGIGNKRSFNPVILKSKKKIYFLIEGTNHVYQLIKDSIDAKQYKIIQLDSTSYFGDNFNLMAFYRKDTIFQFGGYGFWQNRDFFSTYRPLSHDWEFYTNGQGLQSTYSMNYYDKKEDKFYLIGRFHQDSHKSPRPEFKDSVYMYDFTSRKWSTLGKISENIINSSNFDNTLFWVNDQGQYFTRFNDIYSIDASKNKMYKLKKEYYDRLQFYVTKNDPVSDMINFTAGWGDSLLLIFGEPNKFATNKIKFTNDYFDYYNPLQLYEPIVKKEDNLTSFKISIYELLAYIIFNLFIFVSIFYLIHKRISRRLIKNSGADNNAHHFLPLLINQLSTSERELLQEIVNSSLKGKKLDIEAANKILGVQNKQSMIQKTRRSLSITRINDLYMNLSGSRTSLIKRSKDEQDKRIFNYYIPIKESLELFNFLK